MRPKTQPSPNSMRTHLRGLIALLALTAITCGCQPMNLANPAPLENEEAAGRYQIQMVPQFGRTVVEKRELTPGMTIQDALEAEGLIERFRSMEINLARLNNGSVLSMPVYYDAAKRQVESHLDYAIHPGDTISVKAVSPGSLDKLIESITGG